MIEEVDIQNEVNRIGYFAVIPATVLFNNELKPNEKLLYALITTLSNKEVRSARKYVKITSRSV